MKKHLISLLVGLSFSSVSMAEDLLQVYQAAKQNDPQIIKAQASRDVAYSQIDSSAANLLPQIDLSLSSSTGESESFNSVGQRVTNDSESTSAGLSLTQALYRPDLWNRLERSEKAASQADTSLGFATQELIVRTVAAYFDVLRAQDTLEFAVAEKKAIERQLEQTKQRFAVGLTAITDVHEAQAQFDTALASEISAKNDVEVKREVLREITGTYYQDINPLNTERFSAGEPSPSQVNDWVALGEAKNLQLTGAKIAVDIAKGDIDLARTGHLPTVSLSANAGTGTGEFMDFGNRLDSSSISLSLKVPIYSGGATTAGVEQAKQNFVIASQDRESTYRQMVRNVRTSYYDVIAGISRVKALEQAVVSAESALKATQAGFEVGTRTIVDVLTSTRNVFDAKSRLSDARYGYILSVLSLKQSAGTLTEQDVADINKGLQS